MNFPSMKASIVRRRLRIVVPALLMFVAAFAAHPRFPTTNLQSAQQAIANAERVDAASLAPVELGEARSKLAVRAASRRTRRTWSSPRNSPMKHAQQPSWPPPRPAP